MAQSQSGTRQVRLLLLDLLRRAPSGFHDLWNASALLAAEEVATGEHVDVIIPSLELLRAAPLDAILQLFLGDALTTKLRPTLFHHAVHARALALTTLTEVCVLWAAAVLAPLRPRLRLGRGKPTLTPRAPARTGQMAVRVWAYELSYEDVASAGDGEASLDEVVGASQQRRDRARDLMNDVAKAFDDPSDTVAASAFSAVRCVWLLARPPAAAPIRVTPHSRPPFQCCFEYISASASTPCWMSTVAPPSRRGHTRRAAAASPTTWSRRLSRSSSSTGTYPVPHDARHLREQWRKGATRCGRAFSR